MAMVRTIRSLLPTIAVAVSSLFVAWQIKAESPNVVFILSDDQGWGDYSFMGHPHIRTPHLDRLAKESLVLSEVMSPTRCAVPLWQQSSLVFIRISTESSAMIRHCQMS